MLPTRNLRGNGLFKLLSPNSVANVVNRHLAQQINAQCRRNIVGYFIFNPQKCFNKHNDLRTNYITANFCSSSGKGYSTNL